MGERRESCEEVEKRLKSIYRVKRKKINLEKKGLIGYEGKKKQMNMVLVLLH